MKWLKRINVHSGKILRGRNLIILALASLTAVMMISPSARAMIKQQLVLGGLWPGAPTGDITIRATGEYYPPGYIGAPANFQAVYVSDYKVQITWDKGHSANNTIIIAKFGGYPQDVDDGYRVYFGDGTGFTDASVNFEDYFGKVYYRAWSEISDNFSASSAMDDVESIFVSELVSSFNQMNNIMQQAILLIGPFLALGLLSAVALWKENAVLFMIVAGVAMMTGLYSPDIISSNPNTNALGMAIGLSLIAYSFLACGWAFRLILRKGT